MYKSILLMLVSLSLMACFPDPPTGGGGGGTPDAAVANPCTPTTAAGNSMAGFPYDVADFNANILPPLRTGCLVAAGCHGPGTTTRFTVQPEAGSTSTCPEVESFNNVVAQSNYMQGAAMSAIVQKINGTVTHVHPSSSPASMQMTTLFTAFIDAAKTNFEMNGGGGGAAFDPAVFAQQIQPAIDAGGCIGACHNLTTKLGNFGLTAMAQAGTPELTANITAIVEKIDPSLDPAQATMAKFYMKATDGHGTRISDATALGNLESWIAAGLMGP